MKRPIDILYKGSRDTVSGFFNHPPHDEEALLSKAPYAPIRRNILTYGYKKNE